MDHPGDQRARKAYWLLGADGRRYESATPGALGGNAKAKIYGRLDCGSALAAIRGYGPAYTQHRVFFADEEAAIAAGYRPCGNCMRERFTAWKETRKAPEPR
ncbi:metal-binding protein [Sorangium cellulosum]|uniref:Metal-binding protein n=1 Tax=Sorangium cellulosum TaxID=56 RepID=A0A2L0ESR0_SORCE|nr:Ada metal-binding domain-containing protein [Sorangium cellulosum]AUX42329.1 metal-binding protein [Sorangium cellulosum]